MEVSHGYIYALWNTQACYHFTLHVCAFRCWNFCPLPAVTVSFEVHISRTSLSQHSQKIGLSNITFGMRLGLCIISNIPVPNAVTELWVVAAVVVITYNTVVVIIWMQNRKKCRYPLTGKVSILLNARLFQSIP